MDKIRSSGLNLAAVAQLDSGYITLVDNTATGNQPLYIGKARAGTAASAGGWTIQKLTYDANGNVSSIAYANVVSNIPSNFEIWDNRATLTYT